jgi:hypothetical protein
MTQRAESKPKSEIDEEFRLWLRAAAARRSMTQADVAWAFPFQVHPKTVSTWFSGHARPSYHQFVGLCVVLDELPPVLLGLCHPEPSERSGSGMGPVGGTFGIADGPGFRPTPLRFQD